MDSFAWNKVAKEFAFDGSWRDIYVFDVDLQAWQRVLDALRQSGHELVYYQGDAASQLPAAASDSFPAEGWADRRLSVKFAGVDAVCHFFSPEEIEFDIDPREVQGQTQLNALLAFMRLLSDATGHDAVMTPENMPEIVVFRSRPNLAAVEYQEFGGWKTEELLE